MVPKLMSRARDERGFTLIELLVVMIIIAILMAVAIPVFLGQKQKALATNAKTNAKNVQDTMEACAAGTTSGMYVDGTYNCGDIATLLEQEPGLKGVIDDTKCAGQVCVVVSGVTDEGYTITSVTANGTDRVTFEIVKDTNGITKTCTGGAGPALKRMCPTGQW